MSAEQKDQRPYQSKTDGKIHVIKHLPASKFTYPDSCYSFIMRDNPCYRKIEIYLPPGVKVATDFEQWLNKNDFRPSNVNPQAFTAPRKPQARLDAVHKLLANAAKNGAYEIHFRDKPEDLKERSGEKPGAEDIVAILAKRVDSLVDQKLQTLDQQKKIEALEQQLVAKDQEVAELKKSWDRQKNELEQEIESLSGKLADKDHEITSLKKTLGKRQADLQKLDQYEQILGVTSPERSPFDSFDYSEIESDEPPDILHLSSPFSGDEMEVLDADDYDETEYTQKYAPAKFMPEEISLEEIDLGFKSNQQEINLTEVVTAIKAKD